MMPRAEDCLPVWKCWDATGLMVLCSYGCGHRRAQRYARTVAFDMLYAGDFHGIADVSTDVGGRTYRPAVAHAGSPVCGDGRTAIARADNSHAQHSRYAPDCHRITGYSDGASGLGHRRTRAPLRANRRCHRMCSSGPTRQGAGTDKKPSHTFLLERAATAATPIRVRPAAHALRHRIPMAPPRSLLRRNSDIYVLGFRLLILVGSQSCVHSAKRGTLRPSGVITRSKNMRSGRTQHNRLPYNA